MKIESPDCRHVSIGVRLCSAFSLAFWLMFALTCQAGGNSNEGMVPIAKFVLAPPALGTYKPWRDPKERWYAGEIIILTNSSFHYIKFSDVVGRHRDYSGTLSIFKDHIYLNHPDVPYPYRIAGVADGVPVLFTWEGYEQWKKTGKVFELNILYGEKTQRPKK
jgi:hypothetical protein